MTHYILRPVIPDEVDPNDESTWGALAEAYDIGDDVEILEIIAVEAGSSLNLQLGMYFQRRYQIPAHNLRNGITYMIVVQGSLQNIMRRI